MSPSRREQLEYAVVRLLVGGIGILPRPLARAKCILLAHTVRLLHRKLWRVGLRNLEIAFPELPLRERKQILRRVYTGLGRQLAEFCLFPRYTAENADRVVIYEGFENFDAARRAGKGVLLLTGHFGAWEIGSFFHSLKGNPMKIVVRDLDNPLVDALVKRYRTMHGNETIDNREFLRGLLAAMRGNDTVGILMDTNMTPPQGVFVDFFGVPACTAAGMARVAMKTGATVVPAYTIWDSDLKKYKVCFDPPLETANTGDAAADVITNTARYNAALEAIVRRHPDQWLWVHRRWKTRPAGEPPIY
ncbi:MAG TPA: lysophospholipid acyltransferase family protein [Terriglobales bacterium]|nr:lysophospholipid acyltransferase family protein [Terriglobales bacterium]